MSNPPKILIIDDEPFLCEYLEEILTSHGYEIESGNDGRQALNCVIRTHFDVVLLDIGLPDMSGFEAMAQIHRQSPDTLVIMITGDATIESAVEALKSGAYNYLRKPFQATELLKTIKNALDYKRLQEERKQSEKALRESEERFRALVENSLIGICIVQNNKIVYQNSEQGKMYKHLSKKPLNKFFRNIAHSYPKTSHDFP